MRMKTVHCLHGGQALCGERQRPWIGPGGRPAILTVPSLNHIGLLHFIVWSGDEYLPSTGPLMYPGDSPTVAGRKLAPQVASAIVW